MCADSSPPSFLASDSHQKASFYPLLFFLHLCHYAERCYFFSLLGNSSRWQPVGFSLQVARLMLPPYLPRAERASSPWTHTRNSICASYVIINTACVAPGLVHSLRISKAFSIGNLFSCFPEWSVCLLLDCGWHWVLRLKKVQKYFIYLGSHCPLSF